MFTSSSVWTWALLSIVAASAATSSRAGSAVIYDRSADDPPMPADNDRAPAQVEEPLSWKVVRRAVHDNDEPEADAFSPQEGSVSCEVARLKCAYRTGCGMALQNYMVGCSEVISGSTQRCSDHCRNSLIALTSTEEGLALMKCKCRDSFCVDAKRRIDVCRTAVLHATQNTTTVSCSVAQWICMADPLCSTALDYYNQLCRPMFSGKKCTRRCNNSISILRRQEKAAKLTTCTCDGTEDYDCLAMHENMERLCFHKKPGGSAHHPNKPGSGDDGRQRTPDDVSDTQGKQDSVAGKGPKEEGRSNQHHHPGKGKPVHPQQRDNAAASSSSFTTCPNYMLFTTLVITLRVVCFFLS